MDIDDLELSDEQINAELAELHESVAGVHNLLDSPQCPPVTIYSFGFEAEEVLTLYAALRTYLRTAANQEDEDLETLGRVVKLLKDFRPRAVRASDRLRDAPGVKGTGERYAK